MRLSNRETERGKWGALVAAVLMMIFLFGCGGDPYASKYAKSRPDPKAFVGEWRLKDWTMKRTSLPSPLPKILFNADGSFVATNYPGVALDTFSRGMASIDGQGEWAIEQDQKYWSIRFRWTVIAGQEAGYGQVLQVLHETPPYVLHHIIGDPDSGEALVFEQVKK